jgi:hypothetical protein
VSTCYLCATNKAATDDPSPVAVCTKCGMQFCRWDGARHHGTARFYCAVCLVPMLLRGSGIDIGDWPDDDGGDGGGGGPSRAAVREALSVDEFERFCAAMSDASEEHRFKWRPILHEMSEEEAARKVGERLEGFAGGRSRIEEAYRNAADVDVEGVATAIGVAERAARAQAGTGGPLPPPGSRVEPLASDRYQVETAKEKVSARAATAKSQQRMAGA